tara:strand:- start:4445 stop:5041 length:597 start_codon:yes stop_codon:yes gene_type:complete
MKKKQKKIQLTLLSLGFLLILLTYFYYPNINKSKTDKTVTPDAILETDKEDSSEKETTFKKVEYRGVYDFDKTFTVKSEEAHILNVEPDVVNMTKMHVILYLSDGRVVNIVSDRGTYNKVTHDCFFKDNVRATDGNTKIFAENMDLIASNNLVEIYNNVTLDNITGYLKADKINYDFEKKYFKVSMYDSSKIKMKVLK